MIQVNLNLDVESGFDDTVAVAMAIERQRERESEYKEAGQVNQCLITSCSLNMRRKLGQWSINSCSRPVSQMLASNCEQSMKIGVQVYFCI